MARTRNFADVIRKELAADPKLAQEVAEANSSAEIAEEIYAARVAAGLTQSELAELAGTQQSVIARMEDAAYQGHSMRLLNRIAAALNMTASVRFVRKDSAPNGENLAAQTLFLELPNWSCVTDEEAVEFITQDEPLQAYQMLKPANA